MNKEFFESVQSAKAEAQKNTQDGVVALACNLEAVKVLVMNAETAGQVNYEVEIYDEEYDEYDFETETFSYDAGETVILQGEEAYSVDHATGFDNQALIKIQDENDGQLYLLASKLGWCGVVDGKIALGDVSDKNLGSIAFIDEGVLDRKSMTLDDVLFDFANSNLTTGFEKGIEAHGAERTKNAVEVIDQFLDAHNQTGGFDANLALLGNAVTIFKEGSELVQAGDMMLTEASWNEALEDLDRVMNLMTPLSEVNEFQSLGGQLESLERSMGKGIVSQARKIYAPLTETPMDDIRMHAAPRGYDPVFYDFKGPREIFTTMKNEGEELELPEETLMAVSQIYSPDTLEFVQAGGMQGLFVEDQMSCSLYLFPAEPKLEPKPAEPSQSMSL